MPEQNPETKAQLEEAFKPLRENLATLTATLAEERKLHGKESESTKARIDEVIVKMTEAGARLQGLEDKAARADAAIFGSGATVKTAGQAFVESEGFKAILTQGGSFRGAYGMKIAPEVWRKTAIVNATPDAAQPLVMPDRSPAIVLPNQRRLTIRDILSRVPTGSNVIQFSREATFTSAAAPQGAGSSPLVRENVAKAESAMSFELVTVPVETLAHWIPASKQVLADAAQLQGHINTRLIYGLKLEEEDQLLNGTGANNDLDGLLAQATAYDTALDVSTDTKVDTLRRAILDLALNDHPAGVIVVHPTDWAGIELTKDSNGSYVWANPNSQLGPTIWGVPVISTAGITVDNFLAMDNGPDVAQIFDREDASITISTEHSDFFVKNMVAILAEERLALVVYKPLGIITGTFPY